MKNTLLSVIQNVILACLLTLATISSHAQMGVWPGDADNNGVVNVVDQLYMGYAFGAMGDARAVQGIDWQNAGVPPTPWTQEFPEGLNYFYADADGNGIIDLNDFVAIDSNYELTHGVVQGSGYQTEIPTAGSLLDLQINEPEALLEAGELRIDVALGALDLPVEDFYGLAFKVKYAGLENTPISAVEFREADNSWIGNDAVYSYARNDSDANEIDVTVTRLDGATTGGGGTIGQLIVITEDIVLSPTLDTIGVAIDSVRMVGSGFVDLPVLTSGADLILGKSQCNADFTTSTVGCPTIQFTDQSAMETNRPIDRWQWDFGDGRTSRLPSPTHIYENNGIYNTCLTIRTLDGCESTYCEEISIDCINNGCTVQTSVVENSCSEFQFSIDNPDPNRDYFWSVNDSLTSVTDATYLFQTDSAGVFTVCGGYEDLVCPNGTRYCRTITIESECFEPQSNCDFTFTVDTLDCATLDLRATRVVAWSVNDSLQQVDNDFRFQAQRQGNYQICAVVQDTSCSNTTSQCFSFVVDDECFIDSCAFELVVEERGCADYVISGDDNQMLFWYVNDSIMAMGTNYVFQPKQAGRYEVCGYLQDENCEMGRLVCTNFTIRADCLTDCNFLITLDSLSCFEYAFSSDREVTWAIDDRFVLTDTTFLFQPNEIGTYEICAYLEDDACPDGARACRTILIDSNCITDATEETDAKEDFILYLVPNPVQTQLQLQLGKSTALEYVIWDIHGRAVATGRHAHSDRHQFEVGHLTDGIYVMQLEINGVTEVRRFIKQ